MRRWVPFAIGLYMLTPFLLWGGFAAFGLARGLVALEGGISLVLFAASLPLAGLFWMQNLRQLGDSMGEASRLRTAQRVTGLLPPAILGIGCAGAFWLALRQAPPVEVVLAVVATLAMAAFGWLAARAPVEPGTIAREAEPDQASCDAQARQILLFIANVAMALALLAFYWTPMVLLWAVYAVTPVFLLLVMALAWWAAHAGVTDAPPRRAT